DAEAQGGRGSQRKSKSLRQAFSALTRHLCASLRQRGKLLKQPLKEAGDRAIKMLLSAILCT
ncbi:hypothetical protein, partial [Caldilinea sp.]|uniref:hypothetical protein n=1 Tax=Caldilinea sp. TaxID=2293560 RepID=UPI002C6FFF2C|nr:hypothetical protein [Caldilinea sp.]